MFASPRPKAEAVCGEQIVTIIIVRCTTTLVTCGKEGVVLYSRTMRHDVRRPSIERQQQTCNNISLQKIAKYTRWTLAALNISGCIFVQT